MLHRIQVGVVATFACLLFASDAAAQVFIRLGRPQPPWQMVSPTPMIRPAQFMGAGPGFGQVQPFGYFGQPAFSGAFGGGSFSYATQVVTPGWAAAGDAPRMRATLEPAVRMDQAAVADPDIAPAAPPPAGERETIRPAAFGYDEPSVRPAMLAPMRRYGTRGHYGHACWPPYGP